MSDFTKSHISKSDSFETPKILYDELNAEFNFNYDPCPLNERYIIDGLKTEWGSSVFLNPPYSNPTLWIKKAYEHAKNGNIVVGLLRGDTSTRWFHDYVLGKSEIRFIKGRICFNGKRAPFPSIIVVWGKK